MKRRFTIDWLTLGFVMLAFTLILYFKTRYGNTINIDLPESLLLIGFSMYSVIGIVSGSKMKGDDSTSESELNTTLTYGIIAIGLFLVINATIPYVFDPTLAVINGTELSILDQFYYGQLYAISEEVFFRGAVTSFIYFPLARFVPVFSLGEIKVGPEFQASIISGAVFGIYHLERYGFADALLYVFLTGVTMSAIVLYSFKKRKELRIGSTIIAHSFNNGSRYFLQFLGGLL